MTHAELRPSASAFDAVAPNFDERFGAWASVAAQRRAVRSALLRVFPQRGRILEIGGGTGEDALYLAQQGFSMTLTDPSPTMVEIAGRKLAPLGGSSEVVAGEDLASFAEHHARQDKPLFDGAFSNFAPLNCVADLRPVAQALSRLLLPGACAMLVVFGTCCPGEMIVETVRGRPGQALRRSRRGPVPARLAKQHFEVTYHRRSDIVRAFAPWFRLEKRIGIGVAVPPSAAEPWITSHPHILHAMEHFDRCFARMLAPLGDHVLYQMRRSAS